uniref:UDP-N-acetylglucosamine 4-epimerase n=1 Tax=Falco tinnunculus TaxID=100819 RepID=A0A8C4TPX7_FALTI
MAEKILVTGGAGYIGSHCVLELVEAGYVPVVIDNFHNAIRGADALPESLRRVQQIVHQPILFQEADITDEAALQELFSKHCFSAVMHFAGLKAVGESVQKPLDYYRVNLTGTIRLLETMKAHGVRNIVFSSSATVYGDPKYLPLDENHPVGGCTNPYGKSKYFIEEMIRDLCKAERDWNAVLLRYFNPIGAHESGMIGEDPQGIPNNLMPYVAQVAVGRREFLSVFGNDYKTDDGTGVRDYIHVVDLAKGHIAALKKLKENCGCKIYNLGTGTGYSVLQMVRAMEKASGREIQYKVTGRREGDVASCYANAALAERELGWKAAFGLDKMCKSSPFPSTRRPPPPAPPHPPSPPCRPGPVAVAAAESHRLQQELSCGPRARLVAECCSGPALPASPAAPAMLWSSWVQFQLPPLPLAQGRKAGACPASPLLILIPPRAFASHRAGTEGRTGPGPGFGTRGTTPPRGSGGSPCREKVLGWALQLLLEPLLGPACARGSGRIQHSATRVPLSPNRGDTASPLWPPTHPAQGAGEAPGLGGRPGHPLPPALGTEWAAEHLPHGPRSPLSPHTPGSSHSPRPPRLVAPAQLPGAKAPTAAKGFFPPAIPFSPSLVLGTKSHLPRAPAAPEEPLPAAQPTLPS